MHQKPRSLTLDKLPCPVLGVIIIRGIIIFMTFKTFDNFINLLMYSLPL